MYSIKALRDTVSVVHLDYIYVKIDTKENAVNFYPTVACSEFALSLYSTTKLEHARIMEAE